MQDVIIIGAGVIGASIFRELTKYNVKVTMIDRRMMYQLELLRQIQL